MRFELPADKKLAFSTQLDVKWGDMDAYGHVNNAMYFKYMEHVRIEWLRSQSLPQTAASAGVFVANTFCSYLRPLVFPDVIDIQLYVSPPGRSSLDTWVTMAKIGRPDVLCATGGATLVWIDLKSQQPTPIPVAIRQLLERV